MSKIVKYRRYFIYTGIMLLLLISVFIVFSRVPLEKKTDIEIIIEEKNMEALFGEGVVEQTFTPDEDGLCRVEIAFATYGRINHSQVFLEILNENNEVIFSESVQASEIEDDAYFGLDFEPVASSKNRPFRLRISSDAKDAENAVALYVSQEDRYDRGELYINERRADADLAFRTFFSDRYRAESLERFVCLLIVLALLPVILYSALSSRLRRPAFRLVCWTACAAILSFCAVAVYNRVAGYCSLQQMFSAKAFLKAVLFLSPVMTVVSPAFYNTGRLSDRAYVRKRLGEMIRELGPAFTIAFVFLFMLLLYEPILIYSTNQYDFQFNLTLVLPSLFWSLALGVGISFSAAAVFWMVNRMFARTPRVYQCAVIGLFVVFFSAYVQGNWMVKDLPVLSGNAIKWNAYLRNDIASIVLWIVLIISAICFTAKFTANRVVKIAAWISAAFFAMLLAGMLSQVIANDAFRDSGMDFYATAANFDTISDEKNFIIIMMDSVDAVMFDDLLSANEEYREVFEDFTFYTDAMAAYSCTTRALPNILTGKLTKNETAFQDFSNDAYNNSELFGELAKRGYDMNLYSYDVLWGGERAYKILNTDSANLKVHYKEYIRQQMKYVSFKYLPYAYKQYSGIENVTFDEAFYCDMKKYIEDNAVVWKNIKEKSVLNKQSAPVFHYVQVEGAHEPFDQDKNMNSIENGTYWQKGEAVITLLDAYLQRLKNNGVYDSSVIIILADHGHSRYTEDVDQELFWLPRFNPALLIKGRDERHELVKSDVPISYITDLQGAYVELLDGRKSVELFTDVPRQRTRTVLLFEFGKEDHIVEYETDGRAWEWQKLRPTGNIYDYKQ